MIRWLTIIFVVVAFSYSEKVHAATYPTQGEASAACAAALATNSVGSEQLDWQCQHDAGQKLYKCAWFSNGYLQNTCNPEWAFGYIDACPTTEQNFFFNSGSSPSSTCQLGCQFDVSGAGGVAVSSSSTSLVPMKGTGQICDGTEGVGGNAADDCSLDENGTTVCDCSASPGSSFCPGGAGYDEANCTGSGTVTCTDGSGGGGSSDPSGDPNDSGGSDSDNNGGNNGGGDGDPDTPGDGDGTGDGDVDGDEERDIDCNPLSNPDCAYSGSASAKAVCGSAPYCSGDPAQCATLQQTYNLMCAVLTAAETERQREDDKSATTSNSCDVAPSCSSVNDVECKILIQEWESTCMALDLGNNLAPWQDGGDPDYGRDLADEATDVDISAGLDDSGFATASCPADFSMDVMGASFNIEMEPICSIAGFVRVFVILMTLLWAGPYVVRSF